MVGVDLRGQIKNGKTTLGIELGSTRIKSVLISEDYQVIATGNHDWENRYMDGVWTYSLDAIWTGIRESYQALAGEVREKYDLELTTIGAIGISAMMHGYMPFNSKGELLVPFRTWRNTMTEKAARELTSLFNYNIPQRFSIAHLYQAILNQESHVGEIDFMTTLEGYVHWQLTGEKVLGIGDGAGMFPIDPETKDYHQRMIEQFDQLSKSFGFKRNLRSILPKVMIAGEKAGVLTTEGAKLLDPSGKLMAGIAMCPPEGDAGTGMVATNSITAKTGNVSAGTSIFAMLVLEKELSRVYEEIDIVATPMGKTVAMVHCNNCTSDLNAWISLFQEFSQMIGQEVESDQLFETLYNEALKGDKDGGGLLSYGYLSGEHITGLEAGCPLFVRMPNSHFNLANFIRTHLMSALGALKVGLDLLLKEECVEIVEMLGHGGLFKTKDVGQKLMAAAIEAPVTVMNTAGEGGAYGCALLAAYLIQKNTEESLEQFLTERVFKHEKRYTLQPELEDIKGFNQFMEKYRQGLAVEKSAVEFLSKIGGNDNA